MTLSPAQLTELCTRSAAGEGVRAVLAEWGCDDDETLVWLRDNHHAALKEAKKSFAADPVAVERVKERARERIAVEHEAKLAKANK